MSEPVPIEFNISVPKVTQDYGGLSKESGIREEIARIGLIEDTHVHDLAAFSPINSPYRKKENDAALGGQKTILRSRTKDLYDSKGIDFISKMPDPLTHNAANYAQSREIDEFRRVRFLISPKRKINMSQSKSTRRREEQLMTDDSSLFTKDVDASIWAIKPSALGQDDKLQGVVSQSNKHHFKSSGPQPHPKPMIATKIPSSNILLGKSKLQGISRFAKSNEGSLIGFEKAHHMSLDLPNGDASESAFLRNNSIVLPPEVSHHEPARSRTKSKQAATSTPFELPTEDSALPNLAPGYQRALKDYKGKMFTRKDSQPRFQSKAGQQASFKRAPAKGGQKIGTQVGGILDRMLEHRLAGKDVSLFLSQNKPVLAVEAVGDTNGANSNETVREGVSPEALAAATSFFHEILKDNERFEKINARLRAVPRLLPGSTPESFTRTDAAYSKLFAAIDSFCEGYTRNIKSHFYPQLPIVTVSIPVSLLLISAELNSLPLFAQACVLISRTFAALNMIKFSLNMLIWAYRMLSFLHCNHLLLYLLKELSARAIQANCVEACLAFAKKRVELSWHLEEPDEECFAYDLLGYIFYLKGDINQAKRFHTRASLGQLEPDDSDLKINCKELIRRTEAMSKKDLKNFNVNLAKLDGWNLTQDFYDGLSRCLKDCPLAWSRVENGNEFRRLDDEELLTRLLQKGTLNSFGMILNGDRICDLIRLRQVDPLETEEQIFNKLFSSDIWFTFFEVYASDKFYTISDQGPTVGDRVLDALFAAKARKAAHELESEMKRGGGEFRVLSKAKESLKFSKTTHFVKTTDRNSEVLASMAEAHFHKLTREAQRLEPKLSFKQLTKDRFEIDDWVESKERGDSLLLDKDLADPKKEKGRDELESKKNPVWVTHLSRNRSNENFKPKALDPKSLQNFMNDYTLTIKRVILNLPGFGECASPHNPNKKQGGLTGILKQMF